MRLNTTLCLNGSEEFDRKDMEQYLGSKSRVSEVLNGKIHLSMKQVVRLHKGLGIPYGSLIAF